MPSGHLAMLGNMRSKSATRKTSSSPSTPPPNSWPRRPLLSSFPPERCRVFRLPAQVNGKKLRPSSINAPNYQTKDDGAGPLLRLTHLRGREKKKDGHESQTSSLKSRGVFFFWSKTSFSHYWPFVAEERDGRRKRQPHINAQNCKNDGTLLALSCVRVSEGKWPLAKPSQPPQWIEKWEWKLVLTEFWST